MGSYCTYGDVNLMTNIVNDDIANADVTSLITEATSIVNGDLNTKVIRERIEWIYYPENIGGLISKKSIELFLEEKE